MSEVVTGDSWPHSSLVGFSYQVFHLKFPVLYFIKSEIKFMVFWVVAQCCVVVGYHQFRGLCTSTLKIEAA
jgi:hypothetical protein